MYRQVLLHSQQRSLQLILWRPSPFLDIQTYQLNTVTYRTASASYLATRCLSELANQCSQHNPKISKIIADDFYVDDLCTGGYTIEEVKNIKLQVTRVLQTGGFELRKFHSNAPEVVNNDVHNANVQFGETSESKTLGLYWDTSNDSLKYSINWSANNTITKRSILSCISKIFDPLGLIAPIITPAKIIIQR
ncbi:uncharacterized protein LOC125503995 [Dendroctonus ponderosae]|uniref:uncharacterized protein LOC125503995 n=1 Tax=Dendroctonus ponderosae TaxID=77166 RepID=UPI002034F156|nr:uncharacterized protein LOC125503995 [Dendroctonus ponderosae]